MTEKQEETCENCGQKKEKHYYNFRKRTYTNCPGRYSGKKFKAKNHSPQNTNGLVFTEDTPSESASFDAVFTSEGTFNLSEKIVELKKDKSCPALWTEHVREFIKRLKEELKYNVFTMEELIKKIDKLAGKNLSGDL